MPVHPAPASPLPSAAATDPSTQSNTARTIDQYLSAATRENTRRSYANAIQHFEQTWGGFLPASADQVGRYLAAHAHQLAFNTLKHRLAALSRWHVEHGFHDPSRSDTVRQVLKGIKALHPRAEKRAKPLHLKELAHAMAWLERAAALDQARADRPAWLRHVRDRALIALGFWRGFRGDELLRLQVEHLDLVLGEGLTCYLPRTKGDRQLQGATFHVPALSLCCPVAATQEWLQAAGIRQGPLFRGIGRWGTVSGTTLHSNSIIRLLRRTLHEAGVPTAEAYSAHSLRRGFAAWATAQGWDVKALMDYVGWKDLKSALRYVERADPFGRQRIEGALREGTELQPTEPVRLLAPEPLARLQTVLQVQLILNAANTRTAQRAHRRIETVCLAQHAAQQLDAHGRQYELVLKTVQAEQIDERIAELLDTMHRVADQHQCALEAWVLDPVTQRRWD